MKKEKVLLLSIDTSDSNEIKVSITRNEKVYEKKELMGLAKSQRLLPLIAETLKELRLSPTDITEIQVATGPGSFTGVRVGVSVANTLTWLLGIPVNEKKNQLAEPIYS